MTKSGCDIGNGWFDLTGKSALVVGASRGLGREAALALAQSGADVACAARGLEGLKETAAKVQAMGRRSAVIQVDVAKEDQVIDMVIQATETLGGLDILLYSAGIMQAGPSLSLERSDWNRVLDVNLTGAFLACREAGRVMKENGGGRMILISSAFVDRVLPYTLAYLVSKAGLTQMVRNLAHEWVRYNIRVNGVAPGYFETEMPAAVLDDPKAREALMKRIPLRRVGRPAEIGPLAVYLASTASDYMNGEIIRIDGGQSNYTS